MKTILMIVRMIIFLIITTFIWCSCKLASMSEEKSGYTDEEQ